MLCFSTDRKLKLEPIIDLDFQQFYSFANNLHSANRINSTLTNRIGFPVTEHKTAGVSVDCVTTQEQKANL